MADDEEPDVGQAFAALMSGAAQQAAGEADEAPFGWTTDRATGERRPKKAPGSPRGPRKPPPSLEDLKAEKEAQATEGGGQSPGEDRAPAQGKRRRGKSGPPAEPEPIPQHRPGVITKGVNKLYRRAGKILRAMDHDIGSAVIAITENTAPEGEDDSVGAAWDEMARTNPRIRKFLLKAIAGGAWGTLIMAHAPVGVAVGMKFIGSNPGFFGKLIQSMAEPDEDTPQGEGGLPGGMTTEDVSQVFALAEKFMPGMTAAGVAGMAAEAGNGGPAPPQAFVRNQPKNQPRAKRRGG